MIIQRSDQDRRDEEVMLGTMHLQDRALHESFGDLKGIVRLVPDSCSFDEVICTHPVTAIADEVVIQTAGRSQLVSFAVCTLHFYRLRQVFEVCTADQASGGWGHVGESVEIREKYFWN